MDQSQMLSIIGGFYDKLVNDVAEAVRRDIGATAMANIALDPTIFLDLVRGLIESDNTVRDTIRDLVTDSFDGYDITDNREFNSLVAKIDDLDTKVEQLEENEIDADNDNFADAVRSVIRNNI